MNRVLDYINNRCPSTQKEISISEGIPPVLIHALRDTQQGGGLSESTKSSLQNTMSSLRNAAQAETDTFDRYIEDIEQMLEDYKECINALAEVNI